ncbi:rho GTPase-activating protein 28 isoform X2 [Paramormyrops kingsleyae]|uniref:rho GTPase-activating protein 28 isoform X2 n=1 Tax=Paramormyrops kingsleyae TaxID=1676925 RepID=UPI003B96F62B
MTTTDEVISLFMPEWQGSQQWPGRMISQEALCLPRDGFAISQDSMEDYWSEVRNITESGPVCQELLLEEHSMDEAELEEAWLQEAGLSTLVSGASGDTPAEALLSTLTRSQAALVQKRLNSYTQTLRRHNRQSARHVRDIFPGSDPAPGQPADSGPQISPGGQLPVKVPPWAPARGEGSGSGCEPVRETLQFEVPYSEGLAAYRREHDCPDCHKTRRDDGALPVFLPPTPKLGLTRVQDLSSEDMKKISYIALIELTTFFDTLGIELKRNRLTRNKARESGIFGVSLATLLENDQKKLPGSKVPLVFKKLLSKLEQTGLQTEGILRVPGSASRVKHLRQELEAKFYEDQFDWEQVRHNDAAGLLKMFIRELPSPLLTQQHLPAFLAVQNIATYRNQIQALHLLIMLLPEANRDTLKALLEFLRKVVAHEEENRMSLWNVSMIVAPNLFISRSKNAKLEEMQGAAGAAHLVRLLITSQDLLWTVPCFLISHLRKLNEASVGKKMLGSEKSKRKLLRRWHIDRNKGEKTELVGLLGEGLIRVHAPLHAKVSMALLLDGETKAKDVMARFDCENGSVSGRGSRSCGKRHRQYLFEVGGNLGERCLDPDTYLLDLYRVNPNCEWIFKPRNS